MKKVQLIIAIIYILSMVLSSCGSSQQSKYVCNCEEQAKLQKWVQEGIKPANNMSDEEMEDVIKRLTIDGIKIHCKQKPVWIGPDQEIDWKKQKQDSCEIIMNIYQ